MENKSGLCVAAGPGGMAKSNAPQPTGCRIGRAGEHEVHGERMWRGREPRAPSRMSITTKFWSKIAAFMGTLNMDASSNKRKWILGVLPSGKMVGREEAAVIFWAWRCLYAEVVAARVDNRELRPENAYKNTIRMAYTRVKAYGDKWYRWYSKQRYRKGAKVVPRAHREKKLVSSDSDATYVIRRALKDAFRTTVLGVP